MKKTPRLIAYYLPQYHPIPENDTWWGRGFTEWTNVARAKPLFKGHSQPKVPADLGFYDLRLPEVREQQAQLAKENGIEGFCYWHYWFGNGKMLLERPMEEVLRSGNPDFPFCIGWANHSWTGIWDANPDLKLIEQTYPGEEDHIKHFYYWLPYFKDPRYISVEGKSFLLLFRPMEIPECRKATDLWRELALKEGLKGLYIMGLDVSSPEKFGLDAVGFNNHKRVTQEKPLGKWKKLYRRLTKQFMSIYTYEEAIPYFLNGKESQQNVHPTIVTNWDNTPRMGQRGIVLKDLTPEIFRKHVKQCLEIVKNKPPEHQIIMVKSWNEWAEGNYLEPDLRFGLRYLEVLKEELFKTD